MKKLTLLSFLLFISLLSMASKLFLLPTGSLTETKAAFSMNGITIHFYNDDFVIGSANELLPSGGVLIDDKAWEEAGTYYFILYFKPSEKESYLGFITQYAKILHQANEFVIVSTSENQSKKIYPAVHGGMIYISQAAATFPPKSLNYKPGSIKARDDIYAMMAQVNMDTLEAFVQHLQDYGTRNAYKTGGIYAQNWILGKFQSFGLDTELHDFTMPGGEASDNVIATLPGNVYPDEYIILGAHYDSYTGGNSEPGADDNATGTAGILEAARILSQYTFDRTIIFATWSGEEYGLYGSEAWASEAAANGMNILGYFNIDMAGYLKPGDAVHTDIMAPTSASELREFYKDVCAVYLPLFQTFNGTLSGGDSDHTSFNNNGYQGIFPFEDSQDYSPYIHTANDIIGPSVNNFGQHGTFVQAIIANVVSLSDQLAHPENLIAEAGDQEVILGWEAVEGTEYYNIYRNLESGPFATSTTTDYTDTEVVNGTSYTYYVTAIFQGSGEESGPSNTVKVIPMPPISLPFFDDFETGAPYWTMDGTWGLQQGTYYSSAYALTESPGGNYAANLDISTTLRALNFSGAISAEISFWTKYSLESSYDYMYLEISTDGLNWEQLDSFTGAMNTWVQRAYILDDYIGESNVIIRFRFTSDIYVEEDGMYIDDLEITVSGIGINEDLLSSGKDGIVFHPNPATNMTTIDIYLEKAGPVTLRLYDAKGQLVKTISDKWMNAGPHAEEFDVTNLQSGIYYGTMESNGRKLSRKLVITR
jgi:hypothetical protein